MVSFLVHPRGSAPAGLGEAYDGRPSVVVPHA
jgi:hypothetical protein